jgi:hypothetical protein
MKITPATSIQIPRHISKAIKLAMMPTIITLQTIGHFWTTWAAVYRSVK